MQATGIHSTPSGIRSTTDISTPAAVQPVETNYQKPVFNIPEKGQVGEISVPFTDTKKDPYVYADRGYRLFYGTTHWVKKVDRPAR